MLSFWSYILQAPIRGAAPSTPYLLDCGSGLACSLSENEVPGLIPGEHIFQVSHSFHSVLCDTRFWCQAFLFSSPTFSNFHFLFCLPAPHFYQSLHPTSILNSYASCGKLINGFKSFNHYPPPLRTKQSVWKLLASLLTCHYLYLFSRCEIWFPIGSNR